MSKNVYKKLSKHLNSLPGGFPSTETGVEIRILERLFTVEEAQSAIKLTMIPESKAVLARRFKLPLSKTSDLLDNMARKGLIFRYEYGNQVFYMAAQFVIGIWEYHVNDLTPELIEDMNEYIPHIFAPEIWKKAPQLRTIPINRDIVLGHRIMSYEKAEDLIRSQKKILAAPCICRREHTIMKRGCEKPLENCLVFGVGVDFYKYNNIGRLISVDRALEILKEADEKSLVLQPTNAKKVVNICCCCGCCCQVLKTFKKYSKPAELVSTAFTVEYNIDECKGCGLCIDRCQMDAFVLKGDEKKVIFNSDRCIGCGLCVSKCPTKALSLVRKSEKEIVNIPETNMESLLKIARVRGKLGSFKLALMQMRSKIDRFLSAK